jgi:phosphopantothenoylcysteine decarboxylase/phosphopantothenate--cysteine ligase
MWENSIVQSNAKRLIAAGWTMIGPGAGWVACREEGQGRMSEPEEIIESIQSHLLANPRQMTRA